MNNCKTINVWFLAGDPVYLYSPVLFGAHEIKVETIMQVVQNRLEVTYTASNGYTFNELAIGNTVFHSLKEAEMKMNEVMNNEATR